jgi:uncharacterized protein
MLTIGGKEMKNAIWLGVLLLVGFSTMVFGEECDSLRLIRVKGDAVVSVPPDKAVITLGIESRQDKLEPAKQRVDSLMKVVNDLAKEYNIPEKNVRTEQYVIMPANAKRTKHFVNSTVVVTITDMTVLNPFMSRVVDAGVDEVRDVSFQLLDPLAIRLKAREQAAAAAKQKAEAILKALGATLGRVHSVVDAPVSDGIFIRGGRATANTYVVDGVDNLLKSEVSSITIGQIEEQATVEVAFEIGE